MPTVLIPSTPLIRQPGSHLEPLIKAGFTITYPPTSVQLVEADLLAALPGVFGTVAGSEPYTRKVIAASPALKVIARVGVGYDAVDVQAATEHGVVVCTAPGTNQDSVSEHCFMLMLALAKHLHWHQPVIQAGGWPRHMNVPLRGKTLGLAGLGRIGQSMTTRAQAFGMKVIAHDPFANAEFAGKNNVQLVSLEELLRTADYVSLHMPLNPQTKQIINAERLALMKPTAYLINTARGGVIDEAALYDTLKNRRIAGAGLDVFAEEPPAQTNPLLKLENVVMTAHTAGVDQLSLADMATKAATCVAEIYQGGWPTECIINPEVKATFKL